MKVLEIRNNIDKKWPVLALTGMEFQNAADVGLYLTIEVNNEIPCARH